MKRILLPAVRALDSSLASLTLTLGREKPALLSFMFHGLFKDREEAYCGLVDPFQPITVDDFRRFLDFFLAAGYRFVTPGDVVDGLDPQGRYVLTTFDDGYANNLRLPALLKEYQVPATVFVTSRNVLEGRGYWWDVVYREMRKRNADYARTAVYREGLKSLSAQDIEAAIMEAFGHDAFRPVSDVDRPMTPAELADFAAEPLVTIGNHTIDHALLDLCDDDEIERQIVGCQKSLEELTGERPRFIAYPNGNFDRRVVRAARNQGLELGWTVLRGKTRLPCGKDEALTLPRFTLLGGQAIAKQCRTCQSDFQISGLRQRLRATRSSNRGPKAASDSGARPNI